jgi:hypothetical protein
MRIQNVIRMVLVLAMATALVAACGVANPFAQAAAKNSNEDQLLRWAQCMRQHGANVPDPVNGRIHVESTARPVAEGAQFQAARNACKQYQPNGGKNPGPPSQQQLDEATKFTQCMRDHGIQMSDPVVQPDGGIGISVSPGASDPNSDQFKQAEQACKKHQPGGGRGTTTNGGGGSTTGGNR